MNELDKKPFFGYSFGFLDLRPAGRQVWMLTIEKWLELVTFVTKEVIVTAPKPGEKIQNAGRAPVLIAAEQTEAARKAAEAEPTKITTEAEREEAERAAAVAKREADEAEAERVEADRKAAEAETERLAAEAAKALAEREDTERAAAVAKREADEAEAERAELAAAAQNAPDVAKERLGVRPTEVLPSSHPPPPNNPAPTPSAATTAEVNAYVERLSAEEAEQEAKRVQAVTGDVPIVVVLPPVSAPPDPPQWVRGNPRVAMPAVTEQRVRFSQALPRIIFGGFVVMFATFLAATVGGGVYYGLSRTTPSFTAWTVPAHPATNTPPTTATVAAPNPEPIPPGLLPPGAEPGLQGAPGTRVRMSAQAAFPLRCASALTMDWANDVRFLCSRDQRRGNNLCNCDVTGLVP